MGLNYNISRGNSLVMAEHEHCMIFITRYRAVLFDMDGVITDTMPLHLKAWQEAFRPYGIEVEKMDVYLREGQQSRVMAQEIAREKGRKLSDGDLKEIVGQKGKIFDGLVSSGVKIYDAVPELLRMLRNNGLKTAVVTGSRSASAQNVLRMAGVERLFDIVVTGDDTKKGKPDPEPYLKAIKKAGVYPLDCLVIENSPLGIKSAIAAGVDYVIAVTTSLGAEYLEEANDIMGSVADLDECLARRFAARPVI